MEQLALLAMFPSISIHLKNSAFSVQTNKFIILLKRNVWTVRLLTPTLMAVHAKVVLRVSFTTRLVKIANLVQRVKFIAAKLKNVLVRKTHIGMV